MEAMRKTQSRVKAIGAAPAMNGRKGVQSVEHGARLLEALIQARAALPLKLIAERAAMSPSMAHRYLASFIRVDLVRQDPVSGYYDLSTLSLRLGLAALNRSDFIQTADDEMKALVARVQVDGHISVWGDYGPTIVRLQHMVRPILTNERLGGVLPLLTSAAGLIFLAYEPREVSAALLKAERAAGGLPKMKDIEHRIAQVRRDGFATIDGLILSDLRAIAAPVLDSEDQLVATISLVSNRAELVDLPNPVADDFLETGRRISRRLGWNG